MKQFGSSKAECVPDELERKLIQINKMHEDGYKSVLGIGINRSTIELRPKSIFFSELSNLNCMNGFHSYSSYGIDNQQMPNWLLSLRKRSELL